jgi:UDP-2,4-diacetamido-2,4,6-trideoxy-beta-L-altropyranose hydrolase
MTQSLLIRADAGSRIGVGHVMRCLALAQAWQDVGGKAVFVAAELPTGLEERLSREGFPFVRINGPVGTREDADATLAIAGDNDVALVVVDGYAFSVSYFDMLHEAGLRVLALDDLSHLERYPVDALLNQNLSATAEAYRGRVGTSTVLLLGPRFSLLRREFREAAPDATGQLHEPRRVLMTFGGGDVENLTGALMRNLQHSARRDLHVIVLAGTANPHIAALREIAADMTFPCEVRVDVSNMAELMVWADAAITAAGSTVWELASLGVPALIGAVEPNQLAGLPALAAVPFFRAMRSEDLVACDLYAALEQLWTETGQVAADGFDALGAVRVVEFLRAALPGGRCSPRNIGIPAA